MAVAKMTTNNKKLHAVEKGFSTHCKKNFLKKVLDKHKMI